MPGDVPANRGVAGLEKRLYTIAEAARYLAIGARRMRDVAPALPRVRLPLPGGREIRRSLFDVRDLDELIERSKDPAGRPA